jgi:hypothetical protein
METLEVMYKTFIRELAFDKSVEEVDSPENNLKTIAIYSDDSELEYSEEFQKIFDKNYDYFDNQFSKYKIRERTKEEFEALKQEIVCLEERIAKILKS